MRSSTGSIVDRVPVVGDTGSRIVQQPQNARAGFVGAGHGEHVRMPVRESSGL